MIDLKQLLRNQKANNQGFMKEINCSEYDLIYLDEDDEIEAFRRLKANEIDDDSENFDKILEYSEDSHSTSKDQRRQNAQEALAQKQLMS